MLQIYMTAGFQEKVTFDMQATDLLAELRAEIQAWWEVKLSQLKLQLQEKESKGNGPEDGIAPEMLPPANLRTEADFARLEQELVVMREELVALTRDRDERRARLLRAVQEDIESTVSDTFESARFAEGLRAASGQFNGAKAVQLVDAHTGRALDTEGGSVGGDGASVSPRLVLTSPPTARRALWRLVSSKR